MSKFMTFSAPVQAVFNNDANDFMAFSQLMVDTARGTQAVSKNEANAKIREMFQNVLGITNESRPADVRRAIRRNQALVFDIIEETLDSLLVTGWGNDPFMMKYVEQKNLALGDKNSFYTPDDSILSVMRVAGNHHDIIRQRLGAGTETSINTYWVAIKVYAEFERVLTGADDWSNFITKVYEAYDKYIKDTIYDTMVGYTSSIPATYKETGNPTADKVRALCEKVQAANGGAPITILGTRTALSKVTTLQNGSYISNEMKNEHYRTGTLAFFEGIPLVEIPQNFKRNQEGSYQVDNNMLWIFADGDNKFIKLVNEGQSELKVVTDKDVNMDGTYEYEMSSKLGVGIIFNKRFGMYDIA